MLDPVLAGWVFNVPRKIDCYAEAKLPFRNPDPSISLLQNTNAKTGGRNGRPAGMLGKAC